MKLIKPVLILVLTVLVLIVTAIVGISLFVDPNDYREQLSRIVKEQTGRDLVIRESLEIKVFPWIGMQARSVELGNAAGFGPEPFAKVTSLDVRVRLEPLLRKKVEVDTIVVDGLTLSLSRNAQGVGNWESFSKGGKTKGDETSVVGEARTENSAASLMAVVAFQGIRVENGQILWNDNRSGTTLRMENFNLGIGRLVPGQPVAVDMRADVIRPEPAPIGKLAMKGAINIDTEKGKHDGTLESLSMALTDKTGKVDEGNLVMTGGFSFNQADSTLALDLTSVKYLGTTPGPKGVSVQATLSGRADFDPNAQAVKIALKQVGLEAGGPGLAGIKTHAGMEIVGQIDLATMTVVTMLNGLNIEAREGALKEGFARMESTGRVRADLNQRQVEVTMEGMSVKGEGSAFSGGGFTGRMDIKIDTNMEKQVVAAVFEKAVLELTGGAFKTGGGEFKFRGNTRINTATGRMNGRMDKITFALHGPVVDNGRVEGGTTVDWEMTPSGGPITTELRDLAVTIQEGFMGDNGQSLLGCQAKVTLNRAENELLGAIKECNLDAQGPVVGGGRMDGRFSGDFAVGLKKNSLRLKPFSVAIKTTGGTLLGGDSSIDGTFDLTAELEGKHYLANFVKLNIETKGKALQGGWAKVNLKGQVDADLKKGEVRTNASPLDLQTQGGVLGKGRLQLSGPVQIHTLLDGPHIRTSLKEMTLSAQGEDYPDGAIEGTLTGGIDADMKKGTLALSGLEFAAAGAKLSGDMKVAGLGFKPTWEGTWRLHEFNLDAAVKKLRMEPMQTRDRRALQKVSLKMAAKGGDGHVSLEGIELVLDDSRMTGQLKIDKFDPMLLAFDFKVDAIDVDRYRAPEDKKEESGKGLSKGGARESQEAKKAKGGVGLPDMKGKIHFGRLKVSDLRLTDATVNLTANKGVLGIHPMEARLYEGTLKGDVEVDFRASKPKTVMKVVLASVQGGPLLADMTGTDRISGQANSTIDLSMQGLESDEVKRTLSGKTQFIFNNGAIKGINIAKMIRSTYQVIKGQGMGDGDNSEQTDFSEFSASIKLDNGLATNNDLSLKSPLLRVSGEGQADLPKDNLNYLLRVAIVGSLAGQGGKGISELKNITVPIRATGSPTRPKYQVDLKGLVNENLKEEAKQKILEKIDKKLDGGLREKLKEKGLDRVLEQVAPNGLQGILDKLNSKGR